MHTPTPVDVEFGGRCSVCLPAHLGQREGPLEPRGPSRATQSRRGRIGVDLPAVTLFVTNWIGCGETVAGKSIGSEIGKRRKRLINKAKISRTWSYELCVSERDESLAACAVTWMRPRRRRGTSGGLPSRAHADGRIWPGRKVDESDQGGVGCTGERASRSEFRSRHQPGNKSLSQATTVPQLRAEPSGFWMLQITRLAS